MHQKIHFTKSGALTIFFDLGFIPVGLAHKVYGTQWGGVRTKEPLKDMGSSADHELMSRSSLTLVRQHEF